MHRSVLVAVISLFASIPCASAQSGSTALDGAMTGASRNSLTDYDGVYAYHGTTSIALVSTDSLVFAVIDEAKYPLRPLGADRFVNAGGDTIPFRRGVDGKVSGFVERGTYFARRTPLVDLETIASVRTKPRPLGADGRPRAYTYSRPVERHDDVVQAFIRGPDRAHEEENQQGERREAQSDQDAPPRRGDAGPRVRRPGYRRENDGK